MQFQLAKTHRYWWPVTVRIPDPENPGRYLEQSLRVQFEPLPRDEELEESERLGHLATMREVIEAEKARIHRVVKNWDGVVVGKEITPFTPDALEAALQQPWFRAGLHKALDESLSGKEALTGN